MNYAEIKQNIISLGFAEETDYEEFEELGYTYDSINRAIVQIANYFPYIKTYDFDIDDTDEGILYIDMASIDSGFLSFDESPVLIEKDGESVYKKYGDYEIAMDRTVVLDADKAKGSFRIYYNALPARVSNDTPDTFVPELPIASHELIPLLASYYLWLDDEYDKALLYKQEFESMLANIMQKQKRPRATVRKDDIWSVI